MCGRSWGIGRARGRWAHGIVNTVQITVVQRDQDHGLDQEAHEYL
jgi:hypothetical protein